MLFNLPTVDGLIAGRVHCTFRRWASVRVKVGSTFTTRGIVVRITSIEPTTEHELTEVDAAEAGFDSLAKLIRWTTGKGHNDQLYRIGIEIAGPDPRIALRANADLSPTELAALAVKLDRMDRAADTPWTWRTLAQIREHPGVVSTELAEAVGEERAYFKIRVRRLKALGLTESLAVGYQLSPRGLVLLATHQSDSTAALE